MKITRLKVIIAIAILLVLGIVFRLVSNALIAPRITSVTPDPAIPLELVTVFTVSTDRVLSQSDDLTFTMSPAATLTATKKDNTYTITPDIVLSPETAYTFTIYFRGRPLRQLTYNTKPLSQLTESEHQSLQTQADAYFADQLTKTLIDNPWISKLPIITAKYTVIHNPETNGVIVYQKQLLTDAEKQTLIQQLTTQGIPTDKLLYTTP